MCMFLYWRPCEKQTSFRHSLQRRVILDPYPMVALRCKADKTTDILQIFLTLETGKILLVASFQTVDKYSSFNSILH